MARRVLVIGRPPVGAPTPLSYAEMEAVAARVDPDGAVRTVRCDAAEALPAAVERARAGERVEILDVFDHGAPGAMYLGGQILFAADGASAGLVGVELAARLRPCLADTAQLRLLGCNTAAGPTGRMLLARLARALGGHRVAHGTVVGLDRGDFGPDGFAAHLEISYLFSSLAALDRVAPSHDERVAALDRLLKSVQG